MISKALQKQLFFSELDSFKDEDLRLAAGRIRFYWLEEYAFTFGPGKQPWENQMIWVSMVEKNDALGIVEQLVAMHRGLA